MSFKKEFGDWVQYRSFPNLIEVDFHYADNEPNQEARLPYWEEMEKVKEKTLKAIKDAYENSSTQYVLFTHGKSTSRIGKTTSRSVVRGLMRSKEATPYIDRKNCIQHDSVFVAAIKMQT